MKLKILIDSAEFQIADIATENTVYVIKNNVII